MILPSNPLGKGPYPSGEEITRSPSAKKEREIKKITPATKAIKQKSDLENKPIAPLTKERVAKATTHVNGLTPLKIPVSPSSTPTLSLSPPPSTPGTPSTFNRTFTPKNIKEQAEIFQSVARLKSTTKNAPMTVSNLDSGNVNDVYIKEFKGELGIRDVVFKPGAPLATKSALCYGIARIVGIDEAVLPAKKGQASVIGSEQVQSLEDAVITPGRIEDEVTYIQLPNGFFTEEPSEGPEVTLLSNGEEGRAKISYYAPQKEILEIFAAKEKGDSDYVKIKGIEYALVKTPNGFELDTIYEEDKIPKSIKGKQFHKLYQQSNEGDDYDEVLVPKDSIYKMDELFLMVTGNDGQPYLVPAQEKFSVGKEAIKGNGFREYVLKSDQKYYVEVEAKGLPQLIGHEIEGMVQVKVENAFTKAPGASHAINLRASGEANKIAHEAFFKRIDRISFIKAFMAAILLRPQDGKLANLDDSNIMFQANPKNPDSPVDLANDPLHPVWIDYDDMLVSDGELSTDPEITGSQRAEVHCIRNGLMAVPIARDLLTPEEKELVLNMIRRMVLKKSPIVTYLEPFQNIEGGITAAQREFLLNVIDKLNVFITEKAEEDWTLQQLFFAVYPTYKKHWDLLEGSPVSDPVYRALLVGKESVKSLKSLASGERT